MGFSTWLVFQREFPTDEEAAKDVPVPEPTDAERALVSDVVQLVAYA